MGSELNFHTSFHLQSDGQTERIHALLELHLRHYVSANQKDWAKMLDVAQCSYNLQMSKSTLHGPNYVRGYHGTTVDTELTCYGLQGTKSTRLQVCQRMKDQVRVARVYPEKTSHKTKKWTDKKRRRREFQVENLMLVKMYSHTRLDRQHRGLLWWYKGPFHIQKKVVAQAYKVELLPETKYHPISM